MKIDKVFKIGDYVFGTLLVFLLITGAMFVLTLGIHLGWWERQPASTLPPWIHQSTVNGIIYTTGVCSFSDKDGVSHEGISACEANSDMCRCLDNGLK